MNSEIRHRGIIFDIVGNRIDISVEPESACAGCTIKNKCFISNGDSRSVSVITPIPDTFSIGEQVTVSVSEAAGTKAVVLAYVVPLVLVLAVLLTLLQLGFGEVAAGLWAIASAAVWYIGLWFFRKKLSKEIIFKIDKQNE